MQGSRNQGDKAYGIFLLIPIFGRHVGRVARGEYRATGLDSGLISTQRQSPILRLPVTV